MAKENKQPTPRSEAVDLAGRLYALFPSNQRSSGRFDPKTGKMHTKYRGPVVEDYMKHLRGELGVGAVPILDDDTCQWAALDIDNHDQEEDIPIAPIAAKIDELKLPLVACRSKSGGVHTYMFMSKPQPVVKVRALLSKWSEQLGYGGCEIFPKQAKLAPQRDGKKQMGNWINLPYLGPDETTLRWAFKGGKKLGVEQFMALADKVKLGDDDLTAYFMSDHSEAPPCVQKMYAKGVASGNRNEALYSFVVYLKSSDPDGYERRAFDANATVFNKPLARAEAARTIASASRPGYRYRCHEEPNRSLCDRDVCVKRKFGINKNEHQLLIAIGGMPNFTEVRKYITEPIRWEMVIDGIKVSNISTDDLLNFKRVRELIAERLTKVVPLIKNVEWERILQPLMESAVVIEAPDDASITGIIRARLIEFASKTELNQQDTLPKDRIPLLRGLPVVVRQDGEPCVVFRAQDFISYLKRNRNEELKGTNLWFAVRELGVGHTKVRAGDHSLNVWYVPISEIKKGRQDAPAAKFEPGL
jgi:hypothetical protein